MLPPFDQSVGLAQTPNQMPARHTSAQTGCRAAIPSKLLVSIRSCASFEIAFGRYVNQHACPSEKKSKFVNSLCSGFRKRDV
jgi:hypothetical protein